MATLRAAVKLDGLDAASGQLAAVGAAGDKAGKQISGSFGQASATVADFARAGASAAQMTQLTGISMGQAREAAARYGGQVAETAGELRGLALAEEELAAAGMRTAEAATVQGVGFGRLRMSMTSAIASMEGIPPVVARIASTVGVMSAGMMPVITALGLIAAGAVAWKAMSEEADKAAEATKKLADEARRVADAHADDGVKKLTDEIKALNKELDTHKQRLDAIKAGGITAGLGAVGEGGNKAFAWLRVLLGGGGTIAGTAAAFGVEVAKGMGNLAQGISDDTDRTVTLLKDRAEKIAKQEEEARQKRLAAIEAETEAITQAWAHQNERLTQALGYNADKLLDAFREKYKAVGSAMRDVVAELNARAIPQDPAQSQGTALWFFRQIERPPKSLAELLAPTPEQQKAADELATHLQDTFIRGMENIATHWRGGWSSLLSDIVRMAEQASKEIERALASGKLSGGDATRARSAQTALGYGEILIGSGMAGYNIGQQSGSYAVGGAGGALAGAALGAEIGSVVPGIGTAVGAVIGGVTGLVGGLMGAADHIKEARKKFEQSEEQYIASLQVYASSYAQQFAAIEKSFSDLQQAAREAKTSVSADAAAARENAEAVVRTGFIRDMGQQFNALSGPAGAFANQLDAINAKYQANVQTVRALGLGEGALAEAEQIRLKSIEQLINAEANLESINQGLISRLEQLTGGTFSTGDPFASLRQAITDALAQGMTDLADRLSQELKMDEAFQRYLDQLQAQKEAADIAARLDQINAEVSQNLQQRQLQALQDNLAVLNEQLQVSQQSVNTLQNVVATLDKFRTSLEENAQLSILTPAEQLQLAQQNYQKLLSQAMGGDATSATALPDAAQTLLEIARSYYGSTQGYVGIFQSVRAGLTAVSDQFGAQLTVEQQQLKQLQTQTGLIQAQLTLMRKNDTRANMEEVMRIWSQYQIPWQDRLAAIQAIAPGVSLSPMLSDLGNGMMGVMGFTPTGDFSSPDVYWQRRYPDPTDPDIPYGIRMMLRSFGYPGYAGGGSPTTSIFGVGERGPEVVSTGPGARVFTAEQMQARVVSALEKQARMLDARLTGLEAAVREGNREQARTREKYVATRA